MSSHAKTFDPSDPDVRGAVAAEFIGTYLLVFLPTLVATGAAAAAPIAGTPLDSLSVALAFGFTLFILVRSFAQRSGANFNPAVTLGLFLNGKMLFGVAFLYWIAQFIGAILGALTTAAMTYGITGTSGSGYGVTQPVEGASWWQVGLIELIGTTVLTYVIASVALGKQSALDSALSIGGTLFVIVLAGGWVTGGAFNPARMIGPMVASGRFDMLPVYVIAELLGGPLGILLYVRYFKSVDQP